MTCLRSYGGPLLDSMMLHLGMATDKQASDDDALDYATTRVYLCISAKCSNIVKSATLSYPVSPLLSQISRHPSSVHPRTTCECDIALSYTDIYRLIENRRRRPFLTRQFESHPVLHDLF